MLCRYTNKGLLLIVFSLLITACGGENASTLPLPPPAGDSTSGSQVILGPIVGATVSAALASNTANTIETTTTTGSATNLNSAGRFSLQLTGVTDGVWVLVSVTGVMTSMLTIMACWMPPHRQPRHNKGTGQSGGLALWQRQYHRSFRNTGQPSAQWRD